METEAQMDWMRRVATWIRRLIGKEPPPPPKPDGRQS